MMANKTRLGFSTGLSPFFVTKLSGGSYSFGNGGGKLTYDGSTLWIAGGDSLGDRFYVAEIDGEGDSILQEAEITGDATTFIFGGMLLDGDSLYLSYRTFDTPDSLAGFIEIDTSDLSVSLAKEISGVSSTVYGVCTDTSGNIILSGRDLGGGTLGLGLYKFTAAGALSWDYYINTSNAGLGDIMPSANSDTIYAVHLDSTDEDFEIIKINTVTPAVVWQRQISTFVNPANFYSIAVDGSDNVYVFTEDLGTSPDESYLFKWNSSGTLQWQRRLYNASKNLDAGRLCLDVDSSGNTYVAINNTTDDTVQVLKINSSGSEVWEKSISHNTATNFYVASLSTDDTYIHLLCNDNSTQDLYILRLSVNDDEDFGTAGDITVAGAGYISVGTATETESAGVSSFTAGGLTAGDPGDTISSDDTPSNWYTYDSRERL